MNSKVLRYFFARNVHSALNENFEILCKLAVLNTLYDNTFEGLAPVLESSVAIQLCTVKEATSPCEDRGIWFVDVLPPFWWTR